MSKEGKAVECLLDFGGTNYMQGLQVSSESVTSILIILVANPIFTYRELGAIMGNNVFYIKK